MNQKATSREDILEVCRGIVREQGLSGISMRTVASACGIAPGTLYNYFPGKNALVLAVTADVWSDIFSCGPRRSTEGEEDFATHVEKTFNIARAGMLRYPGFLPSHVLDLAADQGPRAQGREMMRWFFGHIEDDILHALDADKRVRENAFTGGLTREGFAELVTQQLVVLLVLGQDDCQPLVILARKVLY